MTFVTANILKIGDRVVEEKHYDSVIDYLTEHYPNGFGEKNCTISVDGIDIQVENYDVILGEDAVVILIFHPALAVGVIGGSVVTFIANLLISAAVSYVVGQIFKPKIPELQTSLASRNTGQASSVYSLNSQQNQAKIGAIIPIIFGSVRTTPALIATPFYRYEENEEYLYQLMCIGQGKFNVEQMLISDTDTTEIQTDYFRYETLEYDDFKTVAGIASKVNDSEYKGLVKTIPDVDNLELRGTPQNKAMVMRFEGSTITFYPYLDGSEPDLSSLSSGSIITISNTLDNDGAYTVSSVLDNVVTVQSHTFTLEPDYSVADIINGQGTSLRAEYSTRNIYYLSGGTGGCPIIDYHDRIEINSVEYSVMYKNNGFCWTWSITNTPALGATLILTDLNFKLLGRIYNAEFSTSYGAFSYDKEHVGFEVDIVYPNGVYNTDAAGEFTARDTLSSIILDNPNISEIQVITTSGKLDNSAIRITYKYIYGDEGYTALQPNMHLNFKRDTPEPSDIKSMDKTYIVRVKFILEEKNYEPLGDLTLLWCKIRATNAISSIGQFSINAWVSRNDVANDVKSVLTDIYTNTTYGGRLPESDLDFPFTGEEGDFILDGGHYAEISPVTLERYIIYGGEYVYSGIMEIGKPLLGFDKEYYRVDDSSVKTPGTKVEVMKYSTSKVNGAIDSKMTLFDAMQMIGKSNRYTVFPVGNDIKLKHDAVKPIRTAKYDETNMFDSLAITYLFEEFAETDSVKITYRDSDEFKEVTAIYPADGVFPEEIELWGCTSESVALAMATYLFKQDRARRKSVEFTTDIQGLIPQFLDRIGIIHNLPKWGISGQISNINGNYITLTCSYDLSDGIYDNIIFRKEDGSVSNILSMVVVDSDTIEVTGVTPEWLYAGEEFDKTSFSMGKSNTFVKDYIVISVVPNGDEIVITATNYDETIY